MMTRTLVCKEEELAPGSVRVVKSGGRAIAVFNVNGHYHAVRDRCPHQGAPLSAGQVGGTMLPSQPHEYCFGRRDAILRCPWHGYEFELATGRALVGDRLRVKIYPVEVQGGVIVVDT